MPSNAKPASQQRPSIFQFHDYRAFLTEWFKHLKNSDRDFSLRKIAKLSGTGHATLSHVLAGRRKLTKKIQENLLPNLKLDASESSFFKLLTTLADSSDSSERLQALKKIQRFTIYKSQHPKEFEVFRYMTHWHYVAIREMAAFPNFTYDPAWIQERLVYPVTVDEVKAALDFLIEHELLPAEKDFKPGVKLRELDCSHGVFQVALRSFHKEMLKKTDAAIDRVEKQDRRLFSYTLAVSKANYEKVSQLLEKTLNAISEIEKAETQADSVYHVTFAAIPLAKKSGEELNE